MQRKENSGAQSTTGVPPIVHDVLRSPGQPLDAAARSFFGPRFGQDFSAVRVHTDAKAAESAQAVNALAYTVGRDVVFNAGQYAPQTNAGRKLLAHELTHVVQQPQTIGALHPSLVVGTAGDAYEREADRIAETITNRSAQPTLERAVSSAPMKLQRVPATADCDTSDNKQITAAYPIAVEMVRKAIRAIEGPTSPAVNALLRKYFNDDSASTLRHTLLGYQNILSGITGSFTIECEKSGSFMYSFFCDGVYAYVRSNFLFADNVHLCDNAFECGDTDLAEIIVHESSHKFDNTDDEEYCWTGCSSSLDRWDAYDNADSFSKFAWEAYNTLP